MKSKIGIEVFEINGKSKKKVFEYRTTPAQIDGGISIINSKFGGIVRAHSTKIAKAMRY